MKTTPKPRATKKSRGELGPFPLPLSDDAVGDAPEDVAEGNIELLEVAIVRSVEGNIDISCLCEDDQVRWFRLTAQL